MGCKCKLIFSAVVVLVIGYVYVKLNEIPPVPRLENTWWGPGDQKVDDESIRPFTINYSDEVLQDLQYRLDHHVPFQAPLENSKQWYGMNSMLLQNITDYWRTKYNWKKRQAFLNKYPHFKTRIQGLDIHFIHVKPKSTNGIKVLPLLLSHGWPGSVREFYEMIPLLTTPRNGQNFVFEVIVPSLPGYGFSDGAAKPGLGPAQIGHIFRNLMLRLGHNKFYLQGGDWGSQVVQTLSVLYPESVSGILSNLYVDFILKSILKLLIGEFLPSCIYDDCELGKRDFVTELSLFAYQELGYFYWQATKPDTSGTNGVR